MTHDELGKEVAIVLVLRELLARLPKEDAAAARASVFDKLSSMTGESGDAAKVMAVARELVSKIMIADT